jgi:glycosyltransferase involved in cell wall biosynthesis
MRADQDRTTSFPDQRLRILFVASHPVQYQSPLFRRFAAHPQLDMHVAYCSLKGVEAAFDPEFDVVVQWDVPLLSGYPWTHIPNRGSGSESFLGLCNTGLWDIIRRGNYDAVISFVGYVRSTFWIALTAAKISKAAFLFRTDATTLVPRNGHAWKRTVKKFLWPRLFRLADQVIVPSSGTRDLMFALGLPKERVTVTPYTVDNDWWGRESEKVDRAAVRASWDASPADAVILFCGKLQPWKRPLDVLHAFARAEISNALLVFAGEGPLRSQLAAEADALGIGSRIRLLGFVNQSALPAVYTASDLMVLPSEYEPFAVVVNEAMCCGCPVAASDHVGAVRDLVQPVHPEFVYPCGDVKALADLLRRALQDRAILKSIGKASLAHMRTWSPEKNIATTISAVQFAVSRVGSRPLVESG